jgi:hypothetical protein
LALAAYLLHKGIKIRPRKTLCVRVKRFARGHKEILANLALEELSEPALNLLNNFHVLPPSMMSLYLVLLIVTILV